MIRFSRNHGYCWGISMAPAWCFATTFIAGSRTGSFLSGVASWLVAQYQRITPGQQVKRLTTVSCLPTACLGLMLVYTAPLSPASSASNRSFRRHATSVALPLQQLQPLTASLTRHQRQACISSRQRLVHAQRPSYVPFSLPPRYTVASKADPVTGQSLMSYDDGALSSSDSADFQSDYRDIGIKEILDTRLKWLLIFCAGLLVSAVIIEKFEGVLEQHVELSFFLPLIIGQGGNSGSQTCSNLIRAIALRQARWRDVGPVMFKEAAAGGIMGGIIGLTVLMLSFVWDEVSLDVGITVAMALPLVSLWANSLAAFITLASHKLKLDPAMTSGPLVSTLVDTTGLMIYFFVAKAIMQEHLGAVLATMLHMHTH